MALSERNLIRDRIADLHARVIASTGVDRRLDAEIDCVFRYPDLHPWEPSDFGGKFNDHASHGDMTAKHGFLQAASYTSSIEAVVRLVQELVPGWSYWSLARGRMRPDEPLYGASLRLIGGNDDDEVIGEHEASAAHALLIVFLDLAMRILAEQVVEVIDGAE